MNEDLFRYKKHFITCMLLIGYAYIHVRLTGAYTDASLEKLIDFSARLPFGQRLLVPFMAHGLAFFLSLDVSLSFFILELFFVSLLYFAMKQLLEYEFSKLQADCLSWLFMLLLPLVSVMNYRFTVEGTATFYYPCDSAALFFTAAGFLFCLKSQWALFIPLIFLATFNRESSVLLVLLIPVLHWERLRYVLKPLGWAVLAYGCARLIILFFVRHLPGGLVEWYFRASTHSYFEVNLWWLLNEQHIFMFMYCLAGLPLFWFAFYDYIPSRYRPIRYLILFYFLGLLLVGNFMEARIFGEIVVLLYLPVCVGVSHWLTGTLSAEKTGRGIVFYVDRYAVLACLTLVAVFRQPLLKGLMWYLRS